MRGVLVSIVQMNLPEAGHGKDARRSGSASERPVRAGRARHPRARAAGCESRCRPAVSVTASQVDGRKMMARRIVYGLFPGVAIFWLSAPRSVKGCRRLRTNKRRGGIARPTASCGSTHQQRIIILKTTPGMVARSAVVTFAKLRPTKTACARGQVQNERIATGYEGFARGVVEPMSQGAPRD